MQWLRFKKRVAPGWTVFVKNINRLVLSKDLPADIRTLYFSIQVVKNVFMKCTMQWAEEHIRKDVCKLNSSS